MQIKIHEILCVLCASAREKALTNYGPGIRIKRAACTVRTDIILAKTPRPQRKN